MENTVILDLFIEKEKEKLYFDLPFTVPPDTQRIDIRYSYERHRSAEENGIQVRREINIIDLALSGPNSAYIGCSGSDRNHIYLSEFSSSQGYDRRPTVAGQWAILVGAYKIADEGVNVRYEITFTPKKIQLFKGDLHMHTTGSDGNLNLEELADMAKKNGLDFIFVADHNNYAHNYHLPQDNDISIFPGVEWTHYHGHASMLGVEKAYDGNYYTNTLEETREKLQTAHDKGAFVSLNHAFCPDCGWKWGFEDLYFDGIEIYNAGTHPMANKKVYQWWQEQLVLGKKIVAVGGSDFHFTEYLRMIGHPTTCVYAGSRGRQDILDALKKGHAYVALQPKNAPVIEMHCGDAIMGDSAKAGQTLSFTVSTFSESKYAQHRVRLLSRRGMVREYEIKENQTEIRDSLVTDIQDGFYRIECSCLTKPDMMRTNIAISNPIYLEM